MFGQGTKHAIHETRRRIGAIQFGQLHGFVDGNLKRCFSVHCKFPECHAQDVPVDCGNLVERPLRCIFGDQVIECFGNGNYTKDDLTGKLGQIVGKRTFLQAKLINLAGSVVRNINFLKYLQGKGTRPGAGFHAVYAS